MADEVQIANMALQKLGAARIASFDEASANARAIKLCYHDIRKAELRKRNWNFAISRSQLPADSDAPVFGRARSFTMPANSLKLITPYPESNFNDRDWIIEGRQIYTDDSSPLNVRFIRDEDDPDTMDALFREALAIAIALHLCEAITQSNTKKDSLKDDYKKTVGEAAQANSFENVAAFPPEDTFVTVRA